MEGKLTIAYKFLTGPDADKWKMSDPPVPRVSEVPRSEMFRKAGQCAKATRSFYKVTRR